MADDNPPFISLSAIPDSTHIAVEYRVFKKQDDSYAVDRFLRAENHTTAMRNATAWAAVYHCEIRDTTQPVPTSGGIRPGAIRDALFEAVKELDTPVAITLQQILYRPLEQWWKEEPELEEVIDRLVAVLRDRKSSIQLSAIGIVAGMFCGEVPSIPSINDTPLNLKRMLLAFLDKALEWIQQSHQTPKDVQ